MCKRNAIRSIAKFLVLCIVFVNYLSNPELVFAAVKVTAKLTAVNLSKDDVSDSIYLKNIYTTNGKKYVGDFELYTGVSTDLVNWDLVAEGSPKFIDDNKKVVTVGYNDELFLSTDYVKYKKVDFTSEIESRYSTIESKKIKMRKAYGSSYYGGWQISDDAKTWYDITEDLPKNADRSNIFLLKDRYVIICDSDQGDNKFEIQYTKTINEKKTKWKAIPSLNKPGFSISNAAVAKDGKTFIISSYSAGDNPGWVWLSTSDFANWEEITSSEYWNMIGGDEDNLLKPNNSNFNGLTYEKQKVGTKTYTDTYVSVRDGSNNWKKERVNIYVDGVLLNSPQNSVSPKSLKLNKTKLTMQVNKTFDLIAKVKPENSDHTVYWSSDNPDIAQVYSNSGRVYARKAGTATITATTADGKLKAECVVVVKNIPVSKVKLSKTKVSLSKGESFQLSTTITPVDATNQNIEWSSNKPKIASVDSSGNITAKKSGKATITAKIKDGNKKATCTVTIK